MKKIIVFVGPQKTGTGWLEDGFRQASRLSLPKATKETYYFDRYYTDDENKYFGYFSPKSAQDTLVEFAPSYGGNVLALERIKATLGSHDVTIVMTTRDPVKRSYSHYRHMIRYGYTVVSLREAVAIDPRIVQDSQYKDMHQEMCEIFGIDKVKVFSLEAIRDDTGKFLDVMSSTLGIDIDGIDFDVTKKVNEAMVPRNAVVSRFASMVVNTLKRYQIYSVSKYARKLGLRKLIERRPSLEEATMSKADEEFLKRAVNLDYQAFLAINESTIGP